MSTNEGDALPIQCPKCPTQFSSISELVDHQKLHTNVLLKCPICPFEEASSEKEENTGDFFLERNKDDTSGPSLVCF